jgi:hypothetical protein
MTTVRGKIAAVCDQMAMTRDEMTAVGDKITAGINQMASV